MELHDFNNLEELKDWEEFAKKFPDFITKYPYYYNPENNVPPSCRYCSNHPLNGGSGICHCILGLPEVTC